MPAEQFQAPAPKPPSLQQTAKKLANQAVVTQGDGFARVTIRTTDAPEPGRAHIENVPNEVVRFNAYDGSIVRERTDGASEPAPQQFPVTPEGHVITNLQ